MGKPILGLDIDDTIVSFMARFLPYLRSRGFDPPATPNDVLGYEMNRWLGCTPDQAQELLDDFQLDMGWRLDLVAGAKPALVHLAQRWDLVTITARPRHIEAVTNALISRHFGSAVSQVIHVGMAGGRALDKWQIAHAIGIHTMVEDSLLQASAAAAHGLRVVLMDKGYGWNQCADLPAGVHRVHSWGQAVRQLRRWERSSWPTHRLPATSGD